MAALIKADNRSLNLFIIKQDCWQSQLYYPIIEVGENNSISLRYNIVRYHSISFNSKSIESILILVQTNYDCKYFLCELSFEKMCNILAFIAVSL